MFSADLKENCQLEKTRNCKKLNICHINVGGLFSKLNYDSLDKFCSDFDIVCFTETKTDLYGFEGTHLNDYFILSNTEDDDINLWATHGSCILVKNTLKKHVQIVENTQCKSIIWIKIDEEILGYEFILGTIYLPCPASNYFKADICDDISDDLYNFELPVCLIGDYNSRTGEVDDLFDNQDYIVEHFGLNEIDTIPDFIRYNQNNGSFKRINKDKTINVPGRNLIDLCKTHDLCIVNGRFGSDKGIGDFTCYTHNGSSTIDYAIVSPGLLTKTSDFTVHEFDNLLSDTHCPISITLSSTLENVIDPEEICEVRGEDQVNRCQSNMKFKWNANSPETFINTFTGADVNNLQEALVNLVNAPSQVNVDEFCHGLNSLFIEKAKECNICKEMPNVSKKSNHCKTNKPWFDYECSKSRQEYYRVKSQLKFTSSSERLKKVKAASKKFKEMIKIKKRTFMTNLHKKIRNLKSNNSKEYWALLNKSTSKQAKHSMSVEVLKEHFKKISTVDSQNTEPFDIDVSNSSINEEINMEFNLDEIKSIIRKLKNGKACGIDHIRNEFLKHCPNEILSVFVTFFNVVLRSGIIPEAWCIGLILPLYKNKGDVNDPDNYRGITLLSCIGKLFTALINRRLTLYVDAVGAMGDEQAGFRYAYSTIDHIFTLHMIIEFYLQKNKKLYCAFIDYKKAFDFVDRSSLWMKLIASGINGNILRVIHNLYAGAKSCVKLNGSMSDYFNCNVGVRQGENLSPLLFAIFLNDFELSISRNYNGLNDLANDTTDLLSDDDVEVFFKMYTLLYADDTIVMAESSEELQKALNAVFDYCNDWKLTVNTSKTKIVIFSRVRVQEYPAFLFGHDHIEVVDDYTYLGTVFNFNGSFKKAIEKQINQGRRAYYALLSKIRKLQLPVDIAFELFNQLIVPILTYGCEVWGFMDLSQLEIFQRKFIKTVLHLNKCTPNAMVYGESGLYPLSCIVDMRMLNFFMRLVNGKEGKLSNIMYKVCRRQVEQLNLRYSWVIHIKNSLSNIGLLNVWEHNGNGLTNDYAKTLFKSRIENLYQHNWLESKSTHSHCVFYDQIKRDFKLEKYLITLDYGLRIALTKFRCRNNCIPISKSRFSDEGMEDELLLCPLCHESELCDEYHYLFVCPFFSDERNMYLGEVPPLPQVYQLTEIFKEPENNFLTRLSKFARLIMTIFDHRDEWENGI